MLRPYTLFWLMPQPHDNCLLATFALDSRHIRTILLGRLLSKRSAETFAKRYFCASFSAVQAKTGATKKKEKIMGMLSWIIFGALAGWVASIIMGNNQRQGCITNIIIGIVGAFIGGFAVELITGQGVNFAWNMNSFIVAVVGAVALLAITGWGRRK